jgi:hypothetical protein
LFSHPTRNVQLAQHLAQQDPTSPRTVRCHQIVSVARALIALLVSMRPRLALKLPIVRVVYVYPLVQQISTLPAPAVEQTTDIVSIV